MNKLEDTKKIVKLPFLRVIKTEPIVLKEDFDTKEELNIEDLEDKIIKQTEDLLTERKLVLKLNTECNLDVKQ